MQRVQRMTLLQNNVVLILRWESASCFQALVLGRRSSFQWKSKQNGGGSRETGGQNGCSAGGSDVRG